MPKISIIIPVYNAKDYLARCLDSAINQTLKDIEIICVNDASTDSSSQILNQYALKDSRVMILEHKINQGEGATRNTGLEIATGQYIAFLDADDALSLNFCEKLYNKTLEKKFDIILGSTLVKQGNIERTINDNELVYKHNNILFFTSYFSSAIYKKAVLDRYNIKYTPNLPLSADFLFVNEFLIQTKTFAYDKEAYYIYFRRSDSMNGAILSDEKIDSGLFVFNKMIDNFNSSLDILENKEGYEYYCCYMFFCYFDVMLRNNHKQKRKQAIEMFIDIFKKIKHNDSIFQKLKKDYPLIAEYFINGKFDEFKKLLIVSNSKQEVVIANLKHKMKKNNIQKIPVFISSDNNYAPYVATVITSILNNTKSFIEFYIMDSGISIDNQKKIKSLNDKFDNFLVEFIKIDEEKYYKNLECKDNSNRIPITTYNSALIPLVKPNLEKVLYLDPDIIVMDDIKKVYDFDIGDYAIGALWEEFGKENCNIHRIKNLNLNPNHKYFNAGVFIINIKKWLESDITNKIFEAWKENEDVLEAANQDVMNIVFDNTSYMLIPPNFNWLNHNYEFYTNAQQNIIIRHFNGMVKPWEISPTLNEDTQLAFTRDKDLFWEIAKMTPFYEDLIKNVKYNDLTKFKVYRLIKNHYKTT